MRRVAILCAFAVALVALPLTPSTLAADECGAPSANGICVPITQTRRPTSPPGVPAVPDTPYWGTYYLFVKPSACTSPLSSDCRGIPRAPGSGIPHPTGGGAIGVGGGVFGVLWQESNDAPGLQRTPVFPRPADRMILV